MGKQIVFFAAVLSIFGACLVGCGPKPLTASSLCGDYIKRSDEVREEAASRLSRQFHSMNAGPMWTNNLDYTCNIEGSQTLQHALGE